MGTEDGTGSSDTRECAERVQCLKSEGISNGVEVANGSDSGEEAQHLKSEGINNGVAVADGNVTTKESLCLKSEAFNNGVALADGNDVTKKVILCLKSEAISNGVAVSDGFDSADRDSGGLECLRTYKRRKHGKSSSESKVQEDSRECVEAASHLADQECFSQVERVSHRTHSEANGHTNIVHNGCSSEPHGHCVTQMCHRVLSNILTSEKFSSLYKAVFENFQGMKAESVFDFSIVKSRMKEKAYEQSPSLFLSDIQQVWQKLQDTGNEIVALAQSLSRMSRTSYCELVGISVQNTFEDEKKLFSSRESDSHMKPVQTEECAMYKICNCRRCGDKADGKDSLVCDSCEEMYHVSCIEPAVKEIPHKSWYCANCTASGIGSLHENCAVCEKLNDAKTLDNVVGNKSFPKDEETLNELEENSNYTYDDIQVSIGDKNTPNCKICGNAVDGEKIKMCGHTYCSNKYYHARCLTSKQLKSCGRRWYCPSCLCRVCFTDQDDDLIVLCDGCDHAYHVYCMKPPRTSIPRGKWFCNKCDAGIQAIRRAKKAYETDKSRRTSDDVSKPSVNLENKCNNKRVGELEKCGGMDMRTGNDVLKPSVNLENKCNNNGVRELEKGGGMDMLLTAANTLNLEESLAAVQIESQRT